MQEREEENMENEKKIKSKNYHTNILFLIARNGFYTRNAVVVVVAKVNFLFIFTIIFIHFILFFSRLQVKCYRYQKRKIEK